LQAEVTERFESAYGSLFSEVKKLNQTAIQSRIRSDTRFRDIYNSYREQVGQAWREANRIQGEKAQRIRSELDARAATQTWLAKHFACLSPFADFIYLATDITGTGLRAQSHFSRIVGEYLRINQGYLQRKVQEARERDPTFYSDSFLDISDRPRFRFGEEPLKDRLIAILPYWGILLFFNVLFFLIAFVGFLKYDVR